MTDKEVALTSIDAYRKAVLSGRVKTQRDSIFRWLCQHTEGYTRNEIAEYTGYRLSAVCGRIKQLIKDGFVAERGERLDKFTGYKSKLIFAKKSEEEYNQLRIF